jgi:hypothetical protein
MIPLFLFRGYFVEIILCVSRRTGKTPLLERILLSVSVLVLEKSSYLLDEFTR